MINLHETGFAQLKKMVEATIRKGIDSADRNYEPPKDYLYLLKNEIISKTNILASTVPSFLFNAGISKGFNAFTTFHFKFDVKPGTFFGKRDGFAFGITGKDKKNYIITYEYHLKNIEIKIDQATKQRIASLIKAKHTNIITHLKNANGFPFGTDRQSDIYWESKDPLGAIVKFLTPKYGEVFYSNRDAGIQIPNEGKRPDNIQVGKTMTDPASTLKFSGDIKNIYDKFKDGADALDALQKLYVRIKVDPDTIFIQNGEIRGDTMYINDGSKWVQKPSIWDDSYYQVK